MSRIVCTALNVNAIVLQLFRVLTVNNLSPSIHVVTGCGETVCQNDAVCSLINNEEVLCSCTPGYSGLYCEIGKSTHH